LTTIAGTDHPAPPGLVVFGRQLRRAADGIVNIRWCRTVVRRGAETMIRCGCLNELVGMA
jgi:hypothetical protein